MPAPRQPTSGRILSSTLLWDEAEITIPEKNNAVAREWKTSRRANSRCMPRNTYLAASFRRSRSSSRASGACSPGPPRCSRNLLFRVAVEAADPPQSRVPPAVMSIFFSRAREKKARLWAEETRRILTPHAAPPPPRDRPCVTLGLIIGLVVIGNDDLETPGSAKLGCLRKKRAAQPAKIGVLINPGSEIYFRSNATINKFYYNGKARLAAMNKASICGMTYCEMITSIT